MKKVFIGLVAVAAIGAARCAKAHAGHRFDRGVSSV
jgi:hypothetical protein